jgi:hypothetical protein
MSRTGKITEREGVVGETSDVRGIENQAGSELTRQDPEIRLRSTKI